jgi:hypothetical protein
MYEEKMEIVGEKQKGDGTTNLKEEKKKKLPARLALRLMLADSWVVGGEEVGILTFGMVDSRRDGGVGGQGRIAATIPHMGPTLRNRHSRASGLAWSCGTQDAEEYPSLVRRGCVSGAHQHFRNSQTGQSPPDPCQQRQCIKALSF